MRKLIVMLGIAGTLALPVKVTGQTIPTYVTLNASGTTTSVVYFAESPFQQVRVVTAIASSDLSSANILFRSGGTPMTVAYTNAAGNQVGVAATNGFAVGDWVWVATKAGSVTNAQIASFGAATNIVFTSNVMATTPGDQIYDLSTPVKLSVGATTNKTYTGDMIYVGGRGRPVVVYVNGTSSCSLDAITARYE